MVVDGKGIAEGILAGLSFEVAKLKHRGVTPTLAVILVGDNPASAAYIRQKQKAAERIGAKLILSQLSATVDIQDINLTIQQFNNDNNVHGLIVQRPLPKALGDDTTVLHSVVVAKDVDGFVPGSPFEVPVAIAVGEMLRNVTCHISNIKYEELKEKKFINWLKSKNIVVIGKGETAGKPIAAYLQKLNCTISIIHSQTPHPTEIMRQADIIISCVGKKRVVTASAIKPSVILVSVGLWRDREGKLRGDYDEEEVGRIASFYTPTPGGVGPVNVACLMQNLLKAAQGQ